LTPKKHTVGNLRQTPT